MSLMNRNQWFGALVAAVLMVVAANAWGSRVSPGANGWGSDSAWGSTDHGWRNGSMSGDSFGDHWSDRYDGGMLNDHADTDSGGHRSDVSGRNLGPGGDWFDDVLNRLGRRSGGHDGWREFVLGGMMAGHGLVAWIDLKRHIQELKQYIWAKFMAHQQAHLDIKPSPVPLPAPLLLFASGLAGLATFLRRGKKALVHD